MTRQEIIQVGMGIINNHFRTNYTKYEDMMADKQTSAAMIGFLKCYSWINESKEKS